MSTTAPRPSNLRNRVKHSHIHCAYPFSYQHILCLFYLCLLSIRPNDSETHFKVVVVSSQFDTATSLVARHRMVNQCLADELAGPIHALSIVAWTTEQWQSKRETLDDGTITYQPEPSPACRGGDGSLPSKRG